MIRQEIPPAVVWHTFNVVEWSPAPGESSILFIIERSNVMRLAKIIPRYYLNELGSELAKNQLLSAIEPHIIATP